MKVRWREETGITIIEVMFVTGIMVLVLSLLFGSMISLAELDGLAQGRETATTHLSTVLEQLRRAGREELPAYTPPVFDGLGGTEKITVECFDPRLGPGAGAAIPLPVNPNSLAEPLPDPLEVRVTIAWIGPRGRTCSISASALEGR